MQINYTRNTMSQTYRDALSIRQKVFVQGQGVPQNIEIDKDEAYRVHFVLYTNNQEAVATLRFLPKDDHLLYLQRMAVLNQFQGNGYGKILIEHALSFAKEQGFNEIILHAQLPAIGFYQKLGFETLGEEFEEAGIKHFNMKKML